MIGVPDTRYARAHGVHIAFQEFGEGPFDVLFVSHPTDPIDLMWDDPLVAEAFRRLGSVARVLTLDLRGAGSSDAVNVEQLPRAEAWVDDLVAVMDAVSSSQAAVVASGDAAHPALLLAAGHPGRVRALGLINACARFVRTEDYPGGAPLDVATAFVRSYAEMMGTGAMSPILAPSRADDPVFVRWRSRCERLAAAPGTMAPLYDYFVHTDSRSALGLIQAPALVLHRADDPYMRLAHGRYLADHIPTASIVELPGHDHHWYSGDVDALIEELIGSSPAYGRRHPAHATSQRSSSPTSSARRSVHRSSAISAGRPR